MAVYSCRISRAITTRDVKKDCDKSEFILNDLHPVKVHDNPILDAILDNMDKWNASPIVWVGNQPYKIVVLELSDRHAVMLQICLKVSYKKNGRCRYFMINKRKIALSFALS